MIEKEKEAAGGRKKKRVEEGEKYCHKKVVGWMSTRPAEVEMGRSPSSPPRYEAESRSKAGPLPRVDKRKIICQENVRKMRWERESC